MLHKDPDKPRAIEVTPAGVEALGVTTRNQNMMPVLDEHEAIPASNEDSDYIVDYFPVPENLVRFDGDLFMLRLRGNAMLNIGMLDGDFVIVRRQNDADNGDIVVARDEVGQTHIKRLFREADAYRLQPENDNMTPIIVRDLTILGKVVGLYRDAIY
ncbi:SOS-response repressor and protease LexA [Weissella sp. DD23]|nr:SOS-response repressor and protease LexA [Weissella sp. DD23]